ncbi:MAG TPA: hypothetical protein PK228_17110 [Saprospiraceae bacterium]|nr:hypothetical protein [Saprospiraceae bacterium]
MTATSLGYEEVAEFIASLNPAKLLELRTSEAMSGRVEELVYKKKDGVISPKEAEELERYMSLEHLIALAKAHARKLLAS